MIRSIAAASASMPPPPSFALQPVRKVSRGAERAVDEATQPPSSGEEQPSIATSVDGRSPATRTQPPLTSSDLARVEVGPWPPCRS